LAFALIDSITGLDDVDVVIPDGATNPVTDGIVVAIAATVKAIVVFFIIMII
jgi:hypothetical protein